jgi:hypothetical protein
MLFRPTNVDVAFFPFGLASHIIIFLIFFVILIQGGGSAVAAAAAALDVCSQPSD